MTENRRRVLQLLADGLTHKEIADHLGLARATIGTRYWRDVKVILGAKNAAHAVRIGFERGHLPFRQI
jgi:DNA-binding NarL/FixJ family response regulator